MIKILTISLGISPYVAVGICFVITVAYSVARRHVGRALDRPRPVRDQDDRGDRARRLRRERGRRHGRAEGGRRRRTSAARRRRSRCCRCRSTPDGIAGVRVDAAARARASSSRCSGGRRGIRAPSRAAAATSRSASSRRKTERDGVLATLFFQVAHYALRPWPWIVTGLATVILYPDGIGQDKEAGVRAGVRRSAADAVARLHDGRLRGRVHVHGRHAAQLGRVVPRERLLQALPEARTRPRSTTSNVSRWATVLLFLASIVVTSQLDVGREARGSSCSRSARARASC